MDAHTPSFLAGLLVVVGVLTLCVSLPLIYRTVPMNRFYGVRIRDAFVSDRRWYDINAYGGRQLAGGSCGIIATGLVGFFVPVQFVALYALAAVAIIVVCAVVPLIRIIRWAKKTRPT